MPRPDARAGSAATSTNGKCGASFEELLHLLTAEHQELQRLLDAQAVENHELRKRLLCEDAAEEPRLKAAESSLWRRQLMAPCADSCVGSQASSPALGRKIPVDADEPESASPPEYLSEGPWSSNQVFEREFYSEDPPDTDKDRRLEVCVQKLRDMLDVGRTRQTVTSDQIDAYLRRHDLYTDQFGLAVTDILERLKGQRSAVVATARPPGASNSALVVRRGSGSSSRMFSGMFGPNSVRLQELAELLLNSDVEKILEPCTPDMLEVVKLLRMHAFHQDTLGILPGRGALEDLEKNHKASRFDQRLDLFMNAVIAINAICMGVFAQESATDWGAPQILDLVFTCIFLLEALIKMNRFGIRKYLCGADWLWNIFDLCIVALGVGDFIMTLAVVSTGSFNTSSLMVLRLLRLGRLLRVIRMSLFREMKLMLNGIVGLLKTLGCAMVILVVSIYITSALMVQIFSVKEGEKEIVPGQEMLFQDMPRAMFTVFRCLNLGDCNASDGTPIALHLSEASGWPFTVVHCILCILMNYGLGSLITALVVDTTLVEAKRAEFKASLKDTHVKHISWSLHRLEQIFEKAQREEEEEEGKQKPTMMFLSRKCFQKLLKQKDVQKILDDMDIDALDRADIFDAIDADGNGYLEIDELVSGLTRMSGKAKKADTVSVRLKIDSLIKRFSVTLGQILDEHRQLRQRFDALTEGNYVGTVPGAATMSAVPSNGHLRIGP